MCRWPLIAPAPLYFILFMHLLCSGPVVLCYCVTGLLKLWFQEQNVMQDDCNNNFLTFLAETIWTPYIIEFSYPKNPKMCDPILVTLLKMQPHSSQNATPSSGTSPLASYKEVPPPPPPGPQQICTYKAAKASFLLLEATYALQFLV